jgi:hypothetical protein
MGRATDEDDNDILIPSRDVISPSCSSTYYFDPLGVKSNKRREPDFEARPSDADRRSPPAKNRKCQHHRMEEALIKPGLDSGSGLPLCPVDGEHPTIEAASSTEQRAENVFGAFNANVSLPSGVLCMCCCPSFRRDCHLWDAGITKGDRHARRVSWHAGRRYTLEMHGSRPPP